MLHAIPTAAAPILRHVAAADIPEVWAFVREGLEDIISRCPTVPWTPRDVRRHLREERAGLYVNDHGFVVAQRCQEHISGEPYMNVWLMWFEPGHAARLRADLMEWLDATCRDWRCEWWEFSSTR